MCMCTFVYMCVFTDGAIFQKPQNFDLNRQKWLFEKPWFGWFSEGFVSAASRWLTLCAHCSVGARPHLPKSLQKPPLHKTSPEFPLQAQMLCPPGDPLADTPLAETFPACSSNSSAHKACHPPPHCLDPLPIHTPILFSLSLNPEPGPAFPRLSPLVCTWQVCLWGLILLRAHLRTPFPGVDLLAEHSHVCQLSSQAWGLGGNSVICGATSQWMRWFIVLEVSPKTPVGFHCWCCSWF